MMEKILINDVEVFSMKNISERLGVPKYQIKNLVKEFKLPPSYKDGNKYYFSKKELLPFLTYLNEREKLKEIKQWIRQNKT